MYEYQLQVDETQRIQQAQALMHEETLVSLRTLSTEIRSLVKIVDYVLRYFTAEYFNYGHDTGRGGIS